MEDVESIDKFTTAAGEEIRLYAVLDGHGSYLFPRAALKQLRTRLQENTKPTSHESIIKAFVETDLSLLKSYLQTSEYTRDEGGTCVLLALLIGKTLHVVNLGDSRAVLCRAGKTVPLSEDHKPHLQRETDRITALGGADRITYHGIPRVNQLAVSRALGDYAIKEYSKDPEGKTWLISHVPEIQTVEVEDDFEFLILACDGLWDVYSSEEAVKLAKQKIQSGPPPNNPEGFLKTSAIAMAQAAINRGSNDNVTVVLVQFRR